MRQENRVGHVCGCEFGDAVVGRLRPLGIVVDGDVVELGGHTAGVDLADPHARALELEAEVTGELVDRTFRRPVQGGTPGVDGHRGADVDQMSLAALDHAGNERSDHQHRGRHVGVHRALDVVQLGGPDRAHRATETGVVDQHVGGNRGAEFRDRVAVPDVERVSDAAGPVGKPCDAVAPPGEGVHHDVVGPQCPHTGLSDAARRTGDDGDGLVAEGHGTAP